ncbi:MAG TPA: Tat pathway signal sequence domain protein [Asticcacaulis sp.]|nr:Tat pathway signal sequence domain protein [Asticcacaulis sp.]
MQPSHTAFNINRRLLLTGSAALGLSVAAGLNTANAATKGATALPATEAIWLDRAAPAYSEGVTFGVPWPRGTVKKDTAFSLTSAQGNLAVQTWPLAYWPDGSVKWTAHATAATASAPANSYQLTAGAGEAPKAPVTVTQSADAFTVTSGDAVWIVPKAGKMLIASATRGGKKVLNGVTLAALAQDAQSLEEKASVTQTSYDGTVTQATLEQSGPVRAVIKLDGSHTANGRSWLPFSVRLYFHAGAESVRIVHSFIFDGDETKDFIRGLSVNAHVPMKDELYNRHVRFSGQEDGVWGEAVRSLTGLRRAPGRAQSQAQVAGKFVDPASLPANVASEAHWIPYWSDFTLSQRTSDGYEINKRTQMGQGWINATSDRRATGLVYAGGAQTGGVALGMKDFWQRCPSRLDVRGAATDEAVVTAWMWSPDAPAMDLRPYRPDWGMDTYEKENEGLDITYEDFEPGWNRPLGIARTTEFTLWALATTPERRHFADMAKTVYLAPRLTVSPERLHMVAGVFGDWSLVDTSTPTRALIEGHIKYQLDYYINQIEQQRWYGFWNYGNVMHSYDNDRHVWKYDIGGFAWDNSELQSDMAFWYGYLRSGRADVFRMAEAMTRQTGEVAVLHLGPYKGFGTRHGVQPFSDSSKQPRVSNASFRRFYYYLAADERCGDLMRDLVDSDQTLAKVFIERKVSSEGGSGIGIREKIPGTVDCSFGTSWGSFLGAWLTEWERTGETKYRDRILNGMNSLAKLKYGWFCGGAAYDLKTGSFVGKGDKIDVSHLNGVFGVMEAHQELFTLVDVPAYKKVWLDYCKYYNASAEEITAFLGVNPKDRSLRDGHSRYTAYAARELKDPKLAERAWSEFFGGDAPAGAAGANRLNPTASQRAAAAQTQAAGPVPAQGAQARPQGQGGGFGGGRGSAFANKTTRIVGPDVLHVNDEDPRVSTNGFAQWTLAAVENLQLVGDTVETFGAKYAPKG